MPIAAALSLFALGCERRTSEAEVARPCARVQNTTVCWGAPRAGEACSGGACIARDPLPAPARFVPPFACGDAGADDTCVQARPRQPDDGEWECSEGSGVTVCRGGLAAAGVSAGAAEAGWICGAHSGVKDAGAYPRVCVDFAPDTPSRDEGSHWSCRYAYVEGLPRRECVRSPSTRAGDRCAAGACPPGTSCVGDRCVPGEPRVGCFFDAECTQGAKCVFGTCRS